MAKAPPPAAEPPRLLGTEALRRAALARSQQRGQRVARRRLAWRWALWGLGRGLRYGGLPVLLGLGAAVWWMGASPSGRSGQRISPSLSAAIATTASATGAVAAVAASPATSSASAPLASPSSSIPSTPSTPSNAQESAP